MECSVMPRESEMVRTKLCCLFNMKKTLVYIYVHDFIVVSYRWKQVLLYFLLTDIFFWKMKDSFSFLLSYQYTHQNNNMLICYWFFFFGYNCYLDLSISLLKKKRLIKFPFDIQSQSCWLGFNAYYYNKFWSLI